MFYTARVVSIGSGAVVSFVTIEIVQIRCHTSSRTVCVYMHCIALPCLVEDLVWSQRERKKC